MLHPIKADTISQSAFMASYCCYAGHVNLVCRWCRRWPHHMPCESFMEARRFVPDELYINTTCGCQRGTDIVISVWANFMEMMMLTCNGWRRQSCSCMGHGTERVLQFGCSASYSVNRFQEDTFIFVPMWEALIWVLIKKTLLASCSSTQNAAVTVRGFELWPRGRGAVAGCFTSFCT